MLRCATVLLIILPIAGCGGDVPSSRTADASRVNAASRVEAQGARINNREAIECIRQTTTEEEQAILAREDDAAVALLDEVLAREDMQSCMRESGAVIYL